MDGGVCLSPLSRPSICDTCGYRHVSGNCPQDIVSEMINMPVLPVLTSESPVGRITRSRSRMTRDVFDGLIDWFMILCYLMQVTR